MARSQSRPGRTLAVFFLGVLITYGLVALAGTWKPELGLDLQGGTRIQLTARGANIDPENLAEAAAIIDSRVKGSGFTEAVGTTQGNRYVIVEIPGKSRPDLEETVKRQAQLRFRLVASSAASGGSATSPSPSVGAGVLLPTPSESAAPNGNASDSASPAATPSDTASASDSGTPAPRPAYPGSKLKPSKTASPPATDQPSPSAETSPSATPSASPGTAIDAKAKTAELLAWAANPPQDWVDKFDKYTCPEAGTATPPTADNPAEPLITCDGNGNKFLLSAAALEGTNLTNASAQIPQQQVSWVVTLDLDKTGTQVFADLSTAMVNTDKQFAIVLDGKVISAPGFTGTILNGQAQITGNFTEESARSLATSLKFGSLPIAFQSDPTTEVIGPTLAGDQLRAGIIAGLAGLILVMIYALFYYRGLGLVVIASLIVAAALTYGLVLLLSKTAGFTLTLPGIAGLIVAVGITADSFIVYFERMRDEMRDGKSMRVAVEAGWKRAWRTCVAADTVSLLAAGVLYVFAAGVVRGFAFALGLSTLIDLVVFFWFTHPLVSWLGRFAFFNRGHKLSGLDAENLGLDALPAGGGPDEQDLPARTAALQRRALDQLRRPSVAVVRHVRPHRRAGRPRPSGPRPRPGH
ncbi:MAG: protein translocase subunit SecD [Nocardioides sp.]